MIKIKSVYFKKFKHKTCPLKELSFNVPLAVHIGVNEAILFRKLVVDILVVQHMKPGTFQPIRKYNIKKLVAKSKLVNPYCGIRITLYSIHAWLPWISIHTCWNVVERLRWDGLISVYHTDKVINDYSNHYFVNFEAVEKWIKYI